MLYPEALVLDSLVYHDVREGMAGLDVSQEELALDAPEAVGPREHFLKLVHTRQNMRKMGYPELTAQPTPDGAFATQSRWRETRRTGFWRITIRNRWTRRSRRNSSAFYRRRSGNWDRGY